MNSFARVLRNLRIENNYRQEDLADFLGLSKQVISNYENALREPSFEILIKLSDFFVVSTDYLLGRTSFRNCSEAHELETCPDDSDDLKEFSIIIYRKLRACLEKTQFLYREKLHQYDGNGSGELFFCLYEILYKDIETFDKILDILMNYRDSSDRDEALKTFLLSSNNSVLDHRVVKEILNIDRTI